LAEETQKPAATGRSRRGWEWLTASALLLVALVLFRAQAMKDLGLHAGDALAFALPAGVLYDLVAVLLVAAIGRAAALLSLTLGVVVWVMAAWTLWLVGLANLLYFRFFGGMLEWWVVRFHLSDVGPVTSSALALAMRPLIVASAACAALAAAAAVRVSKGRRGSGPRLPAGRGRLAGAGTVGALLLLAVLVREIPDRTGLYGDDEGHPMLREQILQVWIRDALARRTEDGEAWSWRSQVWQARPPEDGSSADRLDWSRERLARFRGFRDPALVESTQAPGAGGAGSPPAAGLDTTESLPHQPPSAEETRTVRRRLGLPEAGRVNVILLFAESMRSFELLDPGLRDRVFPGMGKVVDDRGIFFTQAYASALEAGQSVRARFTTLCSMLPNLRGPATYLAHPWIDTPCVAAVLRDAGYRTIWMTSAPAAYHNASLFERAHGTEVFYDEVHFRQQGITQRVGDWGLADLPVLEEVIRVLEREAGPRPFFAALTTISSHFPMSIVPEGPLPAALIEETAGHPDYQAYLSRMIYQDRSLTRFFELFEQSELARDTLVVLVGDHSIPIPPHVELTPAQQVELLFRVPIVLISSGQREPLRITAPVHQLDVAPTVALVAGVAPPPEWLGRGLFVTPASPWVALQGSQIHYRSESRACYTFRGAIAPSCYRSVGVDPLFDAGMVEAPEDSDLTRYFVELGQAVEWLIARDQLVARDLLVAPAGSTAR
jgi:hypothetical protein